MSVESKDSQEEPLPFPAAPEEQSSPPVDHSKRSSDIALANNNNADDDDMAATCALSYYYQAAMACNQAGVAAMMMTTNDDNDGERRLDRAFEYFQQAHCLLVGRRIPNFSPESEDYQAEDEEDDDDDEESMFDEDDEYLMDDELLEQDSYYQLQDNHSGHYTYGSSGRTSATIDAAAAPEKQPTTVSSCVVQQSPVQAQQSSSSSSLADDPASSQTQASSSQQQQERLPFPYNDGKTLICPSILCQSHVFLHGLRLSESSYCPAQHQQQDDAAVRNAHVAAGVVLFNAAIAHHRQGIATLPGTYRQATLLARAEYLYHNAQAQLCHLPSIEQSQSSSSSSTWTTSPAAVDLDVVVMALHNNLAQVAQYFGKVRESQYRLEELTRYAHSIRGVDSAGAGDHHRQSLLLLEWCKAFFLGNVLLLQPATMAPAA